MDGFEEKLKNLQGVVEQLERGNLSLEDAFDLYENGMKIASELTQQINQVSEKISKLEKKYNGFVEDKFDSGEESDE